MCVFVFVRVCVCVRVCVDVLGGVEMCVGGGDGGSVGGLLVVEKLFGGVVIYVWVVGACVSMCFVRGFVLEVI